MKNLMSMVDFLPEHPYSKFLKQPLELWMFVPCELVDGVWEVLEEPDCNLDIRMDELKKYRQAKERCLFVWQKGFDYKIICEMFNDLEDIILFEFELTENAQKQIGL